MKNKIYGGLVVAGLLLASNAIATDLAGRTPTAFDVSQSGEATYSIPIFAPPGTNGMTPQLALVYSHRSRSGTVAGLGWSIAGLSSITRCPRILDADGSNRDVRNDSQDRFCLDGNKLRLTSNPSSKPYGSDGATYQTEIETFSRITSFGTAGQPTSFKVERKDGLIYDYGQVGTASDAVVLSIGQSWARAWALKRIRDRSGNAITFTYEQDTVMGEYRVLTVDYASSSNPSTTVAAPYHISFVWENSPLAEVDVWYLAGSIIKRVKRLNYIDILHDSDIVRRYDLTYQGALSTTSRGRLVSVTECAGSTASDCLPPTAFAYQDGVGAATTAMGGEVNTGYNVPTIPWPMDVNGDGRDDLVYSSSTTSGAGEWMVMFANSAGAYNSPTPTGRTNTNYSGATPIDYNADGMRDLLVQSSGSNWSVLVSTGAGFAAPLDTGAPVTATGKGTNVRALDVNGDGYEDLVWADLFGFAGGDAIRYRLRVPVGGTFSTTAVTLVGPLAPDLMIVTDVFGPSGEVRSVRKPDFNGDGQDDIAYQKIRRVFIDGPNTYQFNYSINVRCLGGPDIEVPVGTQLLGVVWPYFGDFNADGRTDVLYDNGTYWNMRFSAGTSFTAPAFGPQPGGYDPRHVLIDWDSDGYDDIVSANPSTNQFNLSRSTGEGTTAYAATGYGSAGASNFTVMDMNGDGLDDLGYVVAGKWRYRTHAGPYPDLLSQATDGYGNTVTFEYAPLTAPIYTKKANGANAVFPEQDYQGSLYVVKSVTASDGIGGTFKNSFTYEGALVHLKGRGFEGFYRVQSQDDRTNFLARSFFHQLFPKTGAVLKNELYQEDGTTLIARTQNTFTVQSYDNPNAANEGRKLPFVSQSVVTSYAFGGLTNGSLISTATTTNLLHAATGTIYDSTVATTESATANGVQPGAQYTQRVYMPTANLIADTTNWCLGQPGEIQQIGLHNQYGGAQITRTTNVDWDTTKCRPDEIESERGDPSLELTHSLTYDDFGNLSAQATTGVGVSGLGVPPARTTQFYFGMTGQFLRSTTDALSKSTTFQWNEALGVPTQIKDPNGIENDLLYDLLGRRTSASRPGGVVTTWSYDRCISGCGLSKMVVTETLRGGSAAINARQVFLDSYDRPVTAKSQLLSGSYNRIDREFDDLGRLHRQYAPCWDAGCAQIAAATFTYDNLGRVVAASRPLSDSNLAPQDTVISYNGLTVVATDPLGKQSTKVATVVGGVARSIGHDGYSQTFDADSFSNIVRVTDSLGNTLLSNVYNKVGMRREQIDMAAGHWFYQPNALGEVLLQTDAKGHQTAFVYDRLGRMTSRIEHDTGGDVQNYFTYGDDPAKHNIGRLESMTSPGYSEGYLYDGQGRVTKRTINPGTPYDFDFTYNSYSALETLTYPTTTGTPRFALKYEYQNGMLKYVKDANAPSTTTFWTANGTDASGNIIDELRGTSLQTLSGYDAVTGLPDFIQSDTGAVQDLDYTWDGVGNLVDRQDQRVGLAEHFTYDNLHRLTGISGPDAGSVNYDARGNILSRSGNVSAGGSATIEWYSDDLPKKITGPTGYSSEFFYGPNGQRWKQTASYGGTSEETVYIGGLLEKVTRGTTTTWKHYIPAGSGIAGLQLRGSSTALYYLTSDHLGSIDSLTTAGITTNLSYGAFGQRRNAAALSGNPTSGDWTTITNSTRGGFTQHEMLDNLNLIHMNGRVYDQLAGQFISADPFIDGAGSTQGWNRYAYVHNSPLRFVDPSGFAADISKALPIDGSVAISNMGSGFGNLVGGGGLGAPGFAGGAPLPGFCYPIFPPTPPPNLSTDRNLNANTGAGGGTGTLNGSLLRLLGISTANAQATGADVGTDTLRAWTYLNSIEVLPAGISAEETWEAKWGWPGWHIYATRAPLCSSEQQGCTEQTVYKYMVNHFPTPGSTTNAATVGGRDPLNPFGLWEDPITYRLDSQNFVIERITLPGHILYPGRTVTAIERAQRSNGGYDLFLQTYGTGVGFRKLGPLGASANNAMGILLFREYQYAVRANLGFVRNGAADPPMGSPIRWR
jgi:RHS repeat-associated protein